MEETLTISPKEVIDHVEAYMSQFKQEERPLKHVFTPGVYVRSILMAAGDRVISRIHKTRHQFIITKGACEVWIEGQGWQFLTAPYFGITEPGTRRLIRVYEDTLWSTIHPISIQPVDDREESVLDAVKQIEEMIIEPNPEVESLKQNYELQ